MYEDPLTAFLDRWLSWGSKYPVARHQALSELRALLASALAEQRRKDAAKVEARRVKVLSTPGDPTWTEHFAELQTEILGGE
jgi:hypothetical protein